MSQGININDVSDSTLAVMRKIKDDPELLKIIAKGVQIKPLGSVEIDRLNRSLVDIERRPSYTVDEFQQFVDLVGNYDTEDGGHVGNTVSGITPQDLNIYLAALGGKIKDTPPLKFKGISRESLDAVYKISQDNNFLDVLWNMLQKDRVGNRNISKVVDKVAQASSGKARPTYTKAELDEFVGVVGTFHYDWTSIIPPYSDPLFNVDAGKKSDEISQEDLSVLLSANGHRPSQVKLKPPVPNSENPFESEK